MRQGTCSQCGLKGPLQTYFLDSGKVYCEACASKLPQPVAIIDSTICAGCHAGNGNSEFSLVANRPF